MTTMSLAAPALGARGSRREIGHEDPAGDPGVEARNVLAGVRLWWQAAARRAGLDGDWLEIDRAVAGLRAAPHSEAPADLLGASAEQLGEHYVAALSAGTRARHGRHYTPKPLADHLWELARTSLGQRLPGLPLPGLIRDPACGGGALLLAPLRQHLAATAHDEPAQTLRQIPDLIEGVDADPSAAWLASVVLAAELLPLVGRLPAAERHPLPALATVGDGLAAAPRPARAVIMNPPYGRVRLDSDARARWGRYLYGHANLYGLFLGAGLESLDAQGVLAALVPTSFLAGRYFTATRRELASQAPLHSVTFVEERDGVFAGVLQETCIAVFGRKRARRTSIASVNGHVSSVARVPSPRGELPWVMPRRSDDAHVAAAAAKMTENLGTLGWRVSTGPLVWNRRRDDLHPRAGRNRAQVIWAADLDGGLLHRDRARDAMRWLELRGSDDAVMLLREPSILVQRTTAPEQARRIVSAQITAEDLAELGGRAVIENHVNVLRPAASAGDTAITQATLAAVLSTSTIDRLMRCISGSVALSAYELEALPLPNASILESWEPLRGTDLERAVAAAYRP
ncbi:MAG: N-6 DNA methylase [Beijerinckiaceae bacterium]|nr:N-6 DNA methylase [Beijerinckiaceae bacterium]